MTGALIKCNFSQNVSSLKSHELTAAAALLQQSNRFLQSDTKQWKSPKTHGAARLFNYMEASDGSEPETDSHAGGGDELCNRMNLNHRIQSDFLEAGDAGGVVAQEEEDGDETELPLFVCKVCGCEFEDDGSLETHQYTHRHSTASPANTENSKENIDPAANYFCQLCDRTFGTQAGVMEHMKEHSPSCGSYEGFQRYGQNKRTRKQSKPKRVVVPFWDSDEIEVLRHLNGKLRKWHRDVNYFNVKLFDKHMAQLVTRKGLICRWCKRSGLSSYHNRGSLSLHHYWRHNRKMFQCEHCNMRFTHRYQVVLHASEVHVKQVREKTTTVPMKEPISSSSVPASEEQQNFLTNPLTTHVPDASTVHKLGMSFFDHSFLHTGNAMTNHMSIIIPTFPPN